MESVLWALGFLLVAANTFVSLRLFQNSYHDTSQKIGQTAIIWLLPVLGVSLVWYFLNEPISRPHKSAVADRIGHGDGGGQYERAEPESAPSDGCDGGGDGD